MKDRKIELPRDKKVGREWLVLLDREKVRDQSEWSSQQ